MDLEEGGAEQRALADLIGNAGSLIEIANLLTRAPMESQLLQFCRGLLHRKISKLEWEKKAPEEIEAEVLALLKMAENCGTALVDQELVSALLRVKGFNITVGENILRLVAYLLKPLAYTLEREHTGILRRGASTWLARLVPMPKRVEQEETASEEPEDLIEEPPEMMHDIGFELVDRMDRVRKKVPFKVQLRVHLEWWATTLNRLRKEKSKFNKEANWLLNVHLNALCLSGMHYEKETLASLGVVSELFEGLPPQVLNAFVGVAINAVMFSRPRDVFEALYPGRVGLDDEEQDSIHPWQRATNRKLVHALMRKMDMETARAEEDPTHLRKFLINPDSLNIMDLFRQDNVAWSYYLYWYVNQDRAKRRERAAWAQRDEEMWGDLTQYFFMASAIYRKALSTIRDGDVRVEVIKQCTLAPREHFAPCWPEIEEPDAMEVIDTTDKEIRTSNGVLQQFKTVTTTFMQDSQQHKLVLDADKKWAKLSVNEIRFFMRTIAKGNFKREQLDKNLVASLDWLYLLVNSTLFKLIWDEQTKYGPPDMGRLIPASRAWVQLYNNINEKQISFLRMRTIAPILIIDAERALASRTATGFTEAKSPEWKLEDVNNDWVENTRVVVADWIHLFNVYNALPAIRRVLNCLHIFIKPSGLPTLEVAKESARVLEETFKKENFDDKSLKEFHRFATDAKNLDPCLVHLSPRLFETIEQSMELLNWLRESPDDNNFTSSLEEAMGRSEMECPVELWEEQEGKPGRVDEQKLSMLNTVRGYLHDLVFRPDDRLDNLAQLLNILRELRPTDDNVIESLRIANEYRLPLMELLDDHSDNSAPDRLLQLLAPNRRAEWVCSNVVDASLAKGIERDNVLVGHVWLRWVVPRKGQDLEKRQNLNELMDFQSTVVLAKTDQRGEDIQEAIDKFIQQFGWIRQLNENLSHLHQAGHFDYQTFRESFSMDVSPEVIREQYYKTSEILSNWVADVLRERNSYYFLNYYGMKHVWRLVASIESIVDKSVDDLDTDSDVFLTMQDILRLVNPSAATDISEVQTFVTKFLTIWNAGRGAVKAAIGKLSLCGKALTESLKDIPCRERPVDVEKVKAYPTGAEIVSGVHVICADSPLAVFDHILSAYARAKYFPEREQVYVCSHKTSWDDVNTLILRWKRSHEFRGSKLYCLGAVDVLPFDLQRKAVLAIREALPLSKNPLIIVSGQAENQHIVAQFAHCRTTVIPLPEEVIRLYSAELSNPQNGYSQGVHVHTSKHAGAGKTFHIRTSAHETNATYLPVTITHSGDLLNRLKRLLVDKNITSMDYVLLHFDLYDTVREDFNALLFEFVFLGGFDESSSGNQFFWNSETTSIAIEVASGPVIEKLRVCSLLPQIEASVSEKTFIVSRKKLSIGMGPDFDSHRYDGTSLRRESKAATTQEVATADVRVKYVCMGLHMMETNQGRFPYVYEGPSISVLESIRASQSQDSISVKSADGPLNGPQCYNLLMNAIKLEAKKPSLWCLWNFVNVFYWQLRDMHYPESPINCACMPDIKANRADDAASKAKLKGEVVQFLIRTAREFATRQVKQHNPNRIIALYSSGLTRWDWNGVWQRMEFENDGKPAFKKDTNYSGKFFLYWRRGEKAWVIDDIIEPSGPVYSRCSSPDINGKWSTSPDWTDNPNIKTKKIKDKKGHDGNAIKIEGCIDDGGSVSQKENGTYLQLPPYDNINGHPHYLMDKKEYRRHLFWGPDSGWQISPVCNNEEGAFCMSVTANIEGRWRSMPPDKVEDRAQFKFLREDEYDEHAKKTISYAQAAALPKPDPNEKRRVIEDFEKEEAPAKAEGTTEEGTGEESMEELWDNTVKWNDSNHECLLFSNTTHVVSFLSLDPEKMRQKMHPGLLSHLQQNRINVGEDLDKLSSRFHEVLSALTEVQKTEDEAKQILDGKYCLTGDSLLKMLAIFARLRCGVPVVLMGECGCGKTMLITYLCA